MFVNERERDREGGAEINRSLLNQPLEPIHPPNGM